MMHCTFITGRGYYAGHPNPVRAHTKNKFNQSNPQSAVATNNLIECNYHGPGTNGHGRHPQNNAMVTLPRSTSGLVEYTASNFSGQLNGELLVTSWDNKVYRVSFDSTGQLQDFNTLFSNVGSSPLDVTSVADTGLFPGTIWVADFQASGIVVYEPGDYLGTNTGTCSAGSGIQDADGDGFTDADELANGTDICSAADVPADVDGDSISDLTDTDDDNDGIADVNDPFALDAQNGAGTPLGIDYQWENDSEGAGFIGDLGFSGLMVNGVDSYQSQFNLNEMTIIGAAGVVTVDAVPDGDPFNSNNTQQYAFQLGVNASPQSDIFRVHTRVLAPFSGITPAPHQSMGLYIGTGDQDNYTKLVIKHNGFQFLSEVNGQLQAQQDVTASVTGVEAIDLMIEVDPASAIATGYYAITSNGATAAEQQVGTFVFPVSWLTADTRLAVGIISTSIGAEPFPATWDFLTVKEVGLSTVNSAPSVHVAALPNVFVDVATLLNTNVIDDGLPTDSLSIQWTVLSGPGTVTFENADVADTTAVFSEEGTYQLQLSASDGALLSSESISVVVVDNQVVNAESIYRLNVGGPAIADSAGNWLNDSSHVNSGNTWSSAAAVNTSGVSGVPASLFNTERYDPPGGSAIEWVLPVTPGTYEVRLYFSEIFFGAMASGVRVFDAQVENETAFNIDVFAAVGANAAYQKTFIVESNDTLNISLLRQSQNPALKGIEVLKRPGGPSPSNTAPVVSAGIDTAAVVGTPITLNAAVTDDGLPGDPLNFLWQVISGPAGAQMDSGVAQSSSVKFSAAGTYVLRLTVNDGDLSSSDDVTVTVTAPSVNFAPLVLAGNDQQTTVSSTVTLFGAVSDDGLPTNQLTTQWVQQSGPATATIANEDALQTPVSFTAPGSYLFRLLASDSQLSSFSDVTISVTEDQPVDDLVVYRINAGGPKVQNATGLWSADNGGFVSSGNVYTVTSAIDTNATPSVPVAVLQTERWSNGKMHWEFPVAPGRYAVRLYFAETFSGAMSSGARVFDVVVEGQVQTGVDVYGVAGALSGVALNYTVVSDSTLDIELLPVTQNPAIKGLEIIALDGGPVSPVNSAPTINAGTDQATNTGQSISLTGIASDEGLPDNQLSYIWSVVSGPAAAQFHSTSQANTSVVFPQAGVYELQLVVSDGLLSSADTLKVVVTDLPAVNGDEVIYRINAGGLEMPASPLKWQADQSGSSFGNGGKTWGTSAAVDVSAAPGVPAKMFSTERYDPAGGTPLEWALPVAAGNYTVKLYFAEIWPGAFTVGKRKFNVSVEGQTLSNLDVFSEAGANTAIVKTFTVSAVDGEINIAFEHVNENPSIKGIEVISH